MIKSSHLQLSTPTPWRVTVGSMNLIGRFFFFRWKDVMFFEVWKHIERGNFSCFWLLWDRESFTEHMTLNLIFHYIHFESNLQVINSSLQHQIKFKESQQLLLNIQKNMLLIPNDLGFHDSKLPMTCRWRSCDSQDLKDSIKFLSDDSNSSSGIN